MTIYRVLTVILLLVLGGLQVRLWFGDGSFSDVGSLEETIERRSVENDGKRQRNAALAAEIRDLKHGLEAVEDKARSELGLIREGETLFLVTED